MTLVLMYSFSSIAKVTLYKPIQSAKFQLFSSCKIYFAFSYVDVVKQMTEEWCQVLLLKLVLEDLNIRPSRKGVH